MWLLMVLAKMHAVTICNAVVLMFFSYHFILYFYSFVQIKPNLNIQLKFYS